MDTPGLKKRLQRIENPKSGFLSQISRDMKTSLDGIIGFTDLLASQRSGKLNEKKTRYVAEIYENGKQLHALVNDYMDLAKIESGMLDLNYSELDVNEYILWVLDVLEPQMKFFDALAAIRATGAWSNMPSPIASFSYTE